MPGLQVVVSFRVDVDDLELFDATTIAEAAKNLKAWYTTGTADLIEDYTTSTEAVISVNPVN